MNLDGISVLSAFAKCSSSTCKLVVSKNTRKLTSRNGRSRFIKVYETTISSETSSPTKFYSCARLRALCEKMYTVCTPCVHIESANAYNLHKNSEQTDNKHKVKLFVCGRNSAMNGRISHATCKLSHLVQSLSNAPFKRVVPVIAKRLNLSTGVARIIHSVGIVLGCAVTKLPGARGTGPLSVSTDKHSQFSRMYPDAVIQCFTVVVPCFRSLCTRQIGAVVALARKHSDVIFKQPKETNNGALKVNILEFGIATGIAPASKVSAYAKIIVRFYPDTIAATATAATSTISGSG